MKDKKEAQECSSRSPGKPEMQSGRHKYGICRGNTKCEVGRTGMALPCLREIFI